MESDSIGKVLSSGCIGMVNQEVDSPVPLGTKVAFL
jgi:hypothetical protein